MLRHRLKRSACRRLSLPEKDSWLLMRNKAKGYLVLKKFELPEQVEQAIKSSLPFYPTAKAALVPALMECQRHFGHVNHEIAQAVAVLTGVPYPEVASVMSFYSMILTEPTGKYVLAVCRTWSCEHGGARELVKRFRRKYNVELGEIAADGWFSLVEVECLCDCQNAPSMQVVKPGVEFRSWWCNNLTADLLEQILDEVKAHGDEAWRERLVRIEAKQHPPDERQWIWLVTTRNQYPAWVERVDGEYMIHDAFGKLANLKEINRPLFAELQDALAAQLSKSK